MSKVHVVRWPVPLDETISPFNNKWRWVRRLSYMRFQTALDLVRMHEKPVRVLDFGCWAGHLLPSLLRTFDEVWGVDDDSASTVETIPGQWTILQTARRLCESELGSTSGLGLTKATGSSLPFKDGYFDVVFCLDTLAHIRSSARPQIIRELTRVTKPEGQWIFSLPVETGPVFVLKGTARILTGKKSDPRTKGYDYRADLQLLRSAFRSTELAFFPFKLLGSFNPGLVVDCRLNLHRF
jgi:SAM-dependent methyltransferase